MTYLINDARRAYYTDFISDNNNNQGKHFRAVESLLSTKSGLCFPNSPDNTVLSHDIGHFLMRKISRIRADVDAMVLDQSSHDLVSDDTEFLTDGDVALTSFWKLSEDEVQTLVMKSVKKYCVLDPVPTPMLIDGLNGLLPVITHLINSSLVNGYFPADWKEALVKPLLKKAGLNALFSNSHSISNLQFISKVAE